MCNDANAEFVGSKNLFNKSNVIWQPAQNLEKVDQGGGGTIAYTF